MTLRALRQHFDDDTAYDRLMLETLVGEDLVLRQLPPSSVDDLRGPSKSMARTGTNSLGSGARQELLDQLRPLLFVASWKILDLIVELVKELDTGNKPPPGGWRIKQKVRFINTKPATVLEPMAGHPALWTRLAKLYACLEEPRNAVIHRRFKRSPTSGIIPYSRQRRPLRTILAEEVTALARASYGLAEELVAGRPDARRCAAISWELDQLRRITRLAALTADARPGLRILKVNLRPAGPRWRLDLGEIREHMLSQSAVSSFADLEAYIPGRGTVYRGRLEDAPERDSVEFPASTPPSWLKRTT